ncbi:Uncharacterized protein TCM_033819 [Theobroma cacao]|uniref:Uncharacterized protein n=1 Tax=Theobroma cacao TaxID=3641 RepID=A0A061FAQ5_THECC|nr:Uncharacterized protein TCM_033819 [Theobroma cacao]
MEAVKPKDTKRNGSEEDAYRGRQAKEQENRKTYKEILMCNRAEEGDKKKAEVGKISETEKKNRLVIEEQELEWLNRSAMGQLRSRINCASVESRLFSEGIIMQVRPVGGLFVLVTFTNKEEMEEYLDRCPDLEPWFQSLSPYKADKDDRKYRVWVKIEEIPLHIWHDDSFKAIGDAWGNSISDSESQGLEKRQTNWWIEEEEGEHDEVVHRESELESKRRERDQALEKSQSRPASSDQYSVKSYGKVGNENYGKKKRGRGKKQRGGKDTRKQPRRKESENTRKKQQGEGENIAERSSKEREIQEIWNISRKLGLEYQKNKDEVIRMLAEIEGEERKRRLNREKEFVGRTGGNYERKGGHVATRGDFNTVRFEHEKTGRADVERSAAVFNEFIDNMTLLDLPLIGDNFTWCGFRERWVFSKLDRFLVDVEWLNGSQELVQQCLPSSLSDHCPVILRHSEMEWEPKPFKIFNFWMDEQSFQELVENNWKKNEQANNDRRRRNNQQAGYEEIRAKRVELWILYKKEEREWMQKSRVKWVNERDRNTRFFQATTLTRKRVNHIDKLNGAESIVEDPESIKREVVNHFQKLYSKQLVLDVKKMDWEMRTLKRESAEFWKNFLKKRKCGQQYKDVTATKLLDQTGRNQFSFIKGRQLMDCALIANEMVDWMRKTKWKVWIKECITTATISVLVNGSPTSQFKMERGLRQGCPLFSFLFNMVGEVLSGMLWKVEDLGMCKGVVVGDNGMSVTHLQYADDTIIFCEPKIENMLRVKWILRCFQSVSGLRINLSKSHLIGIGVEQNVVENWARRISCQIEEVSTTYLGLPLGVNHNSVKFWKPVIDRVGARLAGWKAKTLSLGGRVTLLRSVLISLPIFFISLFQVSIQVKNELEKIQRNFLWGGAELKRKIHYVKWDKVCNYEECGGIGITNIEVKNRALLNKWIWRYEKERDSLWREVLVAKTKSDPTMLLPSVTSNLGFAVGNGENIKFWQDEWMEGIILSDAVPRIFAQLFGWEIEQWEYLGEAFREFQLSKELTDELVWKREANGIYIAKSFCKYALVTNDKVDGIWKQVWANLAPYRVEAFAWQILHGKIAVKDELDKRGMLLGNAILCVLCNSERETIQHLFVDCYETWKVWMGWCKAWGVSWSSPKDIRTFFEAWNDCQVARLRVAVWGNAKWPKEFPSVLDTYRQLPTKNLNKTKVKERTKVEWELPQQGQMKFNVDGAARGCPRLTGIGAIKEAFIIFTSSRWRNDQKLVIECDSSNAVKWINQSHTAPWRMQKWLIQIERMKEKLVGWDVKHVRREANQRADSLANEGVQLQDDILRVYGNDTGDPAQENLDL